MASKAQLENDASSAFTLRQITRHEYSAQQRVTMPCREPVESADIATPPHQVLGHVRVNIACPTGDGRVEGGPGWRLRV